MKQQKYDIFISYRRKTGADDARLLQQSLKARGYKVFFDYDSLRDGKFDERIYAAIENAPIFILMLSEGSLDTCDKEDDWVRIEIEHALKNECKIIPVAVNPSAWVFPKNLPERISSITKEQISELNKAALFDESISSIISNRFPSDLSSALQIQKSSRTKVVICFLFLTALIVGCFGIWKYGNKLLPYPITTADKYEVNTWVGQMMLLGVAYNDYASAVDDFLGSVKNSIDAGTRTAYDDAVLLFERRVKDVKKRIESVIPSIKVLLKRPNCMPTDVAGVPIFLDGIVMEIDGANDLVLYLERIVDPARPCEKHDRYKYLDLKIKEHKIQTEIFAYSVMGVFYKVSSVALEEFVKAANDWTNIQHLGESREWISNEKELEQKSVQLLNQMKTIVTELATILGDENALLSQESDQFKKLMEGIGSSSEQTDKMLEAMNYSSNLMMNGDVSEDKLKVYRQKLIEAQMSHEQADSMVKKLKETIALQKQVSNTKGSLENTLDRASKKFAPKEGDDVGTLWGKTLRFISLKMPDEAKKCIDVLRRRKTKEFPSAALDAAEAVFFCKGDLPFNDGLLVCMFEPPATSHAIYKIGDIVTAVDGVSCRKFEDYRAKAGRSYEIYRRNDDGTFQKHVFTMPENQPRTALVNLKETL